MGRRNGIGVNQPTDIAGMILSSLCVTNKGAFPVDAYEGIKEISKVVNELGSPTI